MPVPALLRLENVRDVFKRDDVRGIYPDQLNGELVARIARGFVALLRKESVAKPRVAVGRDARSSSVDLLLAFCRGVSEAGGEPTRLGLASTEFLYYAAGKRSADFDAGVMITASHNPRDYNGIKMIREGCVPLDADDLAWIRDHVVEGLPPLLDLRQEFAEHLLHLAGMTAPPAKTTAPPLKVVVEAGHGVGGQAFAPIAQRLEATGSVDFSFSRSDPNGSFPGGVPNPLLNDYMDYLGAQVRTAGADLGVGFDGDGDRAGFVDHEGTPVTASQVLALVSRKLLASAPRSRPVVMRNLCCSKLLAHIYPTDGPVELLDTPVGHGRIKLLMRHPEYSERVVFAGEHSGHYFYPEFYHVDSGTLTALHMLRITAEAKAQGLSLADKLREWRRNYAWSGEINFAFGDPSRPKRTMRLLWQNYQELGVSVRYEIRKDPTSGLDTVAIDNGPYDPDQLQPPDLKLEFPGAHNTGWWLVVRPSGNEPKLRLNVETWGDDAQTTLAERLQDIREVLVSAGGRELTD